jgi:hypothetical protein
MAAEPFATPSDVSDRWRPLTDAETTRATVLIADASRMIRRRWPDVDARIASPVGTPGHLDADDLTMIVANMVKRAMIGGVETGPGVTEQAETVGPFAVTRRFSNPLGNLYLSGEDILALDLPDGAIGGRRAFVIDLTPDYS